MLNDPNSHGPHGGGSGGSTGDGYIASLSIDTLSTSPTLGQITAIRQPGGVGITSAQSTTDLFFLKSQMDTFVAALQASLTALTARVTALEAQRLTAKLDPNLTALPVDTITLDSNHFSKQYFAASKTLHIYTARAPPL